MIEKEDLEEVEDLKTRIESQSRQMDHLYTSMSKQERKLTELTPDNEILLTWIQGMTHFAVIEINEVVKIEKYFPGAIKKAIEAARNDYMRSIHFDDFITAAKTIALEYLESLSDEQKELLKDITVNTMSLQWCEVKDYNLENLSLVPKQLQDAFAAYLYYGTLEHEKKVNELAAKALAMQTNTM